MNTRNDYKRLLEESFLSLKASEKRQLVALAFGQLCTSLLDLVALGFIGVTAALAANGVTLNAPNNYLLRFTQTLRLDSLSIQNQVLIFASVAVGLFVLRTLLSITITKKTLKTLFIFGTEHADKSLVQVLESRYEITRKIEVNRIRFALTRGSQALYVGFLGGILSLIGDVSIVFILGVALTFIDTETALVAALFFGIIGYVLHLKTHSKILRLASKETEIDIETGQAIEDLLVNYKFLTPRGGISILRSNLIKRRMVLANFVSELTFLPSFSKYFLESALIIGAILVSGFQFLTKDAESAIISLGIFLAAGSRISPAVLRVQQSLMLINRSISMALTSYELSRQLIPKPSSPSIPSRVEAEFKPEVSFMDVSFCFLDSQVPLLKDISMEISEGNHVAIIGKSGAGKSTLLNLMLGIVQPSSGKVMISGLDPEVAIELFPGIIGYVPQETYLISGSIKENLLFGWTGPGVSNEQIWNSLRKANLEDFVSKLPLKLDQPIGELGSALSGGQRQRLALARALITNPRILILDEATSSVDLETETLISKEFIKLKGAMTIISIAHRQETIALANEVYELQDSYLKRIR